MGSSLSVGRETETDEMNAIGLICSVEPAPALLLKDSDLLEVRRSKVDSIPSNFSNGLFAKQNLPPHTTVCFMNTPISFMANDAMFDMKSITNAKTGEEMFEALVKCRNGYYNLEEATQRVNVITCALRNDNKSCYMTTRFIAKGEEILRLYGFSTWLKELAELNILTTETVEGLLRYIEQVAVHYHRDPFHSYFNDVVLAANEIRSKVAVEAKLVPTARLDAPPQNYVQFGFRPNLIVEIGATKSIFLREN